MAEKETQETIFTCRFTINLAAELTTLCHDNSCVCSDCPFEGMMTSECSAVTVADWVQVLKDKVR